MTRKQWLETFIHLAVSGAAALEYRKRLKIKTNVLGIHIKKLGGYQEELADIKEAERLVRVKQSEEKDKARRDFAVTKKKIKAKAKEKLTKPTKITSELQGTLPPATVDPEPKED